MRYIEEKLAQLDQTKRQKPNKSDKPQVQTLKNHKQREPPTQSPKMLVPVSLITSATQSASMREIDNQFGQMLHEYKTQ